MYSPSVDVNLMQIVVQLHYIPPNLWAGKNIEQLRASIGEFVERVTGARDDVVDFVRVRV